MTDIHGSSLSRCADLEEEEMSVTLRMSRKLKVCIAGHYIAKGITSRYMGQGGGLSLLSLHSESQ